ncbi:MAG: YitT family protein [Oscillospiraceae bacterium]
MKKHPISFDKKKVNVFALDILITIIGTFMFAVSIHCFTAPNLIAPGGVTGISTIISKLTGLKLGGVNIVINIPIMALGFWYLGKRFMLKTIISLISFTVFVDYVLVDVPVYTQDKLVAAIFGGVLLGAALGIILSRGSSSGGMDIVNKLIAKRVPHLKFGKIVFATDFVIVTASAIAFKSIEPAFYALILLYITSVALDTVLYGFNVCKCMYIISEKSEIISQRIISEMNRGATIFESYGAYTKQKRPTIMVAVRQNEYFKLKKLVNSIDPTAFMIAVSANEIVGSGFSKNDA